MNQTTFNFKERFVPKLEDGTKRTTIRQFARTKPPRYGQILKFFTGMRTKNCRRVGDAVCLSVQPIEIMPRYIIAGKKRLTKKQIESLAVTDGFENSAGFRKFFEETYGGCFCGFIVGFGKVHTDKPSPDL